MEYYLKDLKKEPFYYIKLFTGLSLGLSLVHLLIGAFHGGISEQVLTDSVIRGFGYSGIVMLFVIVVFTAIDAFHLLFKSKKVPDQVKLTVSILGIVLAVFLLIWGLITYDDYENCGSECDNIPVDEQYQIY